MRILKNQISLIAATVAAAMAAPATYLRGIQFAAGRNSFSDTFSRPLTRGELSSGRTKPKQTCAQNQRAARKAKNIKRHRSACRG